MKTNRRPLRRLFLVPLLLAALLSAGCVQKPADILIKPQSKPITGSRMDEKVIQLVTENYVPYSFEENGHIRGIAVDMVNEACSRIGYTADTQVRPWTRALQMAEDGDVDGIFCAFYSDERAVFLQYMEEPLVYESQMLYALPGHSVRFDGTMASLKDSRVGILQDYFYGEAFEDAVMEHQLTVERVTDIPTNILKLLDGRIDVMVDHRFSIRYYLKKMAVTAEVVELPVPFREPAPLYLAFVKKRFIDADLIAALNAELIKMKQDGTYDRIVSEYR